MEGTNQVAPTSSQVSSPMPTASAASAAPQPAISQQPTYQASPAQTAPVYQQQAAPAPAGNPWQEAFQALSASLNSPSQSLTQASPSAYQTPTTQMPTAPMAAQGSLDSRALDSLLPSAYQISQPQASTADYTAQAQQQAQLAALQQAQALAASQSVSAPTRNPDAYLSQISDTSLEVLEHFGAEAPALLNEYACAVEDALIEQVQQGQSMNLMLNAAGEERAAMNVMLTDPDILADYVNEFFGPEGPYPTMTSEEEAAYNQQVAVQQFEAELQDQETRQVPVNFQRPQMEMPTPGAAQGGEAVNFWQNFSEIMDRNPEDAWKHLSAAPNGAFQVKALVQDA